MLRVFCDFIAYLVQFIHRSCVLSVCFQNNQTGFPFGQVSVVCSCCVCAVSVDAVPVFVMAVCVTSGPRLSEHEITSLLDEYRVNCRPFHTARSYTGDISLVLCACFVR